MSPFRLQFKLNPHYGQTTCSDRGFRPPSLRAVGSMSRKPGVLGRSFDRLPATSSGQAGQAGQAHLVSPSPTVPRDGCPVARPSPRSRYGVPCIMRGNSMYESDRGVNEKCAARRGGRRVYEAKRIWSHYLPLLTERPPGLCTPLRRYAKPHSILSMPRLCAFADLSRNLSGRDPPAAAHSIAPWDGSRVRA